jgi:hypothetical protein
MRRKLTLCAILGRISRGIFVFSYYFLVAASISSADQPVKPLGHEVEHTGYQDEQTCQHSEIQSGVHHRVEMRQRRIISK